MFKGRNLMTIRQHSLTEEQVLEITHRLSMHSLSKPQETRSFIDFVNNYLSIPEAAHDEMDKNSQQRVKIINDISKHCSYLAKIFSEPYVPPNGVHESATQSALESIWPFHGQEHKHYPNYVDFHGLVEPLTRIVKHAELRLAQDPYTGHIRNRGRNKNLKVDFYVANIVFGFRSHLNRLPILSETSNDFIVFETLFDAYGYFAADRLRILKVEVRKQREQMGLKPREKFG